jgi:repressor LexA
MRGLTKRQKLVLDFIQKCIEVRGYPPTLREIGAQMGITSTNGVNDHLHALERKGYLKREEMKSRALRPTLEVRRDLLEVPLIGRVAAGEPLLAVEQATDTFKIDRALLHGAREVFALRVKGDSMIEAGIFDGDVVFVKRQDDARRGDTVVALIGEEATVKHYYPERDYVRFQPANSTMAPILVRKDDSKSIRILGVVVGLYRSV